MSWQFGGVVMRDLIPGKLSMRWIALISLTIVAGAAALLILFRGNSQSGVSLVLKEIKIERWPNEILSEGEKPEYIAAWLDLKNDSKNPISYRAFASRGAVEYSILKESTKGWAGRTTGFCGTGIQNLSLQPGGQLRFEAVLQKGSRVKVAVEFFGTNSKHFGDYLPGELIARVPWLGRWKTVTSDVIDLREEVVVRLLKYGKAGMTDEQRLSQEEFEMAGKYFSGSDGEKNRPKGIELYESAALHGNAEAAYNLGMIYEHGLGVGLDSEKAKDWYLKASQTGHVLAGERLVALSDGSRSTR